jgi:hypothetical protein
MYGRAPPFRKAWRLLRNALAHVMTSLDPAESADWAIRTVSAEYQVNGGSRKAANAATGFVAGPAAAEFADRTILAAFAEQRMGNWSAANAVACLVTSPDTAEITDRAVEAVFAEQRRSAGTNRE